MNILEQAPIPLAGPGLVSKSSVNYGPGEYAKLTNLVISDAGTLKKRKPVIGLHSSTFNADFPERVVGVLGSDALISKYDYVANTHKIYRSLSSNFLSLYSVSSDAAIKTAMDAVTGFTGTERYYYVQGIFTYNNTMYWIYLAVNRTLAGSTYTYSSRTFIVPSTYNYTNPDQDVGQATYTGSVYAVETANWSESYVFSATQGPVPYIPVVSYFVHKERVIIASRDTVYFSKATDPTKWAVADDAGFFKFPGKSIKKVLALGDLIYTVFDTSIHVATYGTSPNVDLRIDLISDGVGGEDAALYGDTLYVLNFTNIYVVKGSNVSKLVDIDTFLGNTPGWQSTNQATTLNQAFAPSLKIHVWDDAIYFYFRQIRIAAADKSIFHVRYQSYTPYGGADMFRLDLKNGHISRFTFGYGGANYLVADSVTTISAVRNSDSRMYLMHADSFFGNIFYFAKNQKFYPNPANPLSNTPYFGLDSYGFGGGPDKNTCTIPIEMQIKNFSPDGLSYMYRKFRSLEMQADLPSMHTGAVYEPELELVVEAGIPTAYAGAKPYNSTKVISEVLGPSGVEIATSNIVTSYRYGLNQRARNIDVTLRTRASIKSYYSGSTNFQEGGTYNGIQKALATLMELVDITTLWTPSNKGASNSSSERA